MAGKFHDADSAGDLMLLVGLDKELIRASSKVLSLASPVFASMLGPHFAEGRLLLENGSLGDSAACPTEVTLPDDDPEAMIQFCNTIHFTRHATRDIAYPLLAKMASLSDKYDCSLALSSVSDIWLSNFRGPEEGQSWYVRMLWISYALGNHRAFSRISQEMIHEYSHDDLLRQKHDEDCKSLPETIIDSAEEIRASHFSKLCDEIGSLLTLHMEMACPKASDHQRRQSVCFHVAKSGFYVQELYRIGLWPIKNTNTQMSIREISNRLRCFQDYYISDPNTVGHRCDLANIDFKQRLVDATGRMISDSGLCLHCVKKGKIMSADGNCRAASVELCKGFLSGLDRA